MLSCWRGRNRHRGKHLWSLMKKLATVVLVYHKGATVATPIPPMRVPSYDWWSGIVQESRRSWSRIEFVVLALHLVLSHCQARLSVALRVNAANDHNHLHADGFRDAVGANPTPHNVGKEFALCPFTV